MKSIRLLIPILFVVVSLISNAQLSVQAGTQIPLFYTIGGEYKWNDKFALNGQVGLMTTPYDKIVLDAYESFSGDTALTSTIGDAFSYGFKFEPTVKYYMNKTYIGVNYSYIYLVAKDAPQNAIENYYGVSLSSATNIPGKFISPKELTLTSGLHNLGILVGRKFDLKNPKLKLGLEFWMAKTLVSKSTISAENRDLTKLSEDVNTELNKLYVDYGYLASLNVLLSYSFGNLE